MNDQTEIIEKQAIGEFKGGNPPKDHSHFFSLSLRGLITLTVVWTVCGMSIYGIEIKEPLYTLVGLCVGYYFGQGNKPKTQQ